VVAVVGFSAPRRQHWSRVPPAAPAVSQAAPPISVEPPPPARTEAVPAQVERSKPSPDQPTNVKPIPSPQVTANSPDFLVTDLAGYSHTLDDYRGHVVVLGIWDPSQKESAANLDELYKAFGAKPKFRFLGIANGQRPKPAGLTFPVVYNHGSKLFGARAGEFVVLDESGSVKLRGSLVRDVESLRRALQSR